MEGWGRGSETAEVTNRNSGEGLGGGGGVHGSVGHRRADGGEGDDERV